MGDNLPYDLLVDSGQEIHRLQIKSTTTEEQGKSRKYGFALNHGKDSSSYHADTVDFFISSGSSILLKKIFNIAPVEVFPLQVLCRPRS